MFNTALTPATLETVIAPDVPVRAPESVKVPPATTVGPLYVFAPESSSVPVPVLVTPSVPASVPFCRIPENTVSPPSAPVVSTTAVADSFSTTPEPLSDPMAFANPFNRRVPPLPMV